MSDRIQVESVYPLAVVANQGFEFGMGGIGGGLCRKQAKPQCDTVHVGVNRHRGKAQTEQQYA